MLKVYISPTNPSKALVAFRDWDYGVLRAAIVDLNSKTVISNQLIPESSVRGIGHENILTIFDRIFSWSPDGRYVAMPISPGEYQVNLAVVSLTLGEIKQYASSRLKDHQLNFPDMKSLKWVGGNSLQVIFEIAEVDDLSLIHISNQPTYKRLAIKSNDKVLYRCNPTKPCHFLPKDKVDSFDGGYNQVKIGQDTTFYRVSRDPNYTLYNVKRNAKAEEQFSYWKRDKSKGTQAIIDMAIPVSKNGNTAEYITAIRIPQGTIIYEGKVAKQGGLVGGGNQVVLKNIKKEWILQQY